MSFRAFAESHGLIIRNVERGKWVRVPTVDHPRKRNGSFFYDGDYGHVQNWATMDKCETWREGGAARAHHPELEARIDASRAAQMLDALKRHGEAAATAQAMLDASVPDTHPYLAAKGFPELKAPRDIAGRLLIRAERLQDCALRGLQTIDAAPPHAKLFLKGMNAKGSVHRLGSPRGPETWLVEGYATGLSVDAALALLRVPAAVLITFSAGNLAHVGQMFGGRAFVYADNDESSAGEQAAKKTGLPFCMSDIVGEDANDEMMRAGLFAVRSRIQKLRRSQ